MASSSCRVAGSNGASAAPLNLWRNNRVGPASGGGGFRKSIAAEFHRQLRCCGGRRRQEEEGGVSKRGAATRETPALFQGNLAEWESIWCRSWMLTDVGLLVYRLCVLCLLVVLVFADILLFAVNGQILYWPIYLTTWNSVCLLIYFLQATYFTRYAYAKTPSPTTRWRTSTTTTAALYDQTPSSSPFTPTPLTATPMAASAEEQAGDVVVAESSSSRRETGAPTTGGRQQRQPSSATSRLTEEEEGRSHHRRRLTTTTTLEKKSLRNGHEAEEEGGKCVSREECTATVSDRHLRSNMSGGDNSAEEVSNFLPAAINHGPNCLDTTATAAAVVAGGGEGSHRAAVIPSSTCDTAEAAGGKVPPGTTNVAASAEPCRLSDRSHVSPPLSPDQPSPVERRLARDISSFLEGLSEGLSDGQGLYPPPSLPRQEEGSRGLSYGGEPSPPRDTSSSSSSSKNEVAVGFPVAAKQSRDKYDDTTVIYSRREEDDQFSMFDRSYMLPPVALPAFRSPTLAPSFPNHLVVADSSRHGGVRQPWLNRHHHEEGRAFAKEEDSTLRNSCTVAVEEGDRPVRFHHHRSAYHTRPPPPGTPTAAAYQPYRLTSTWNEHMSVDCRREGQRREQDGTGKPHYDGTIDENNDNEDGDCTCAGGGAVCTCTTLKCGCIIGVPQNGRRRAASQSMPTHSAKCGCIVDVSGVKEPPFWVGLMWRCQSLCLCLTLISLIWYWTIAAHPPPQVVVVGESSHRPFLVTPTAALHSDNALSVDATTPEGWSPLFYLGQSIQPSPPRKMADPVGMVAQPDMLLAPGDQLLVEERRSRYLPQEMSFVNIVLHGGVCSLLLFIDSLAILAPPLSLLRMAAHLYTCLSTYLLLLILFCLNGWRNGRYVDVLLDPSSSSQAATRVWTQGYIYQQLNFRLAVGSSVAIVLVTYLLLIPFVVLSVWLVLCATHYCVAQAAAARRPKQLPPRVGQQQLRRPPAARGGGAGEEGDKKVGSQVGSERRRSHEEVTWSDDMSEEVSDNDEPIMSTPFTSTMSFQIPLSQQQGASTPSTPPLAGPAAGHSPATVTPQHAQGAERPSPTSSDSTGVVLVQTHSSGGVGGQNDRHAQNRRHHRSERQNGLTGSRLPPMNPFSMSEQVGHTSTVPAASAPPALLPPQHHCQDHRTAGDLTTRLHPVVIIPSTVSCSAVSQQHWRQGLPPPLNLREAGSKQQHDVSRRYSGIMAKIRNAFSTTEAKHYPPRHSQFIGQPTQTETLDISPPLW
eukprot:GHVS01097234.1.p1 GENE.GHVS01097234.1~~GHVS01097234.1.p1  ORF type:complete len:1254 (-),score=308.81 GHVS01097234.1:674-4435(-)